MREDVNERSATHAVPAPEPVLGLEHVSHAFGARRVVDDVTLAIGAGEIVCLLGPSGCGKTTLLRLAAGLEPLQAGRIVLEGRVIAEPGREVPPEDRRIGFVFQDYALFPHLDALGNVAFGLRALSPAERHRRAMEMLERVGMAGYAASYPHMLSGGEQQRIALARALAPGPRVLLLDEPFSNLDVRLRESVRAETQALLRRANATTLIVTHDAEEAMFLADRVAVMRDGRLAQVYTPDAVYARPASAFVTTFLGFVNRFHAIVSEGRAASALGIHGAPELLDGTLVDVLIRPEDVIIGGVDGGVPATVLARHRMGPETVVDLALDPGWEVRAKLAGADAPAVGCRVVVAARPAAALVFPCADPEDRPDKP